MIEWWIGQVDKWTDGWTVKQVTLVGDLSPNLPPSLVCFHLLLCDPQNKVTCFSSIPGFADQALPVWFIFCLLSYRIRLYADLAGSPSLTPIHSHGPLPTIPDTGLYHPRSILPTALHPVPWWGLCCLVLCPR